MKKKLLIVNSDPKESSYGGVAPFMRNMHPYLDSAFDVTYLYPERLKHGSIIPNRIATFLFFLRNREKMAQYDFVLSHIPEASYVLSFMSSPFAHIFHGNDNPMSVSRFKGARLFRGIYNSIYRRIDRHATLCYTVGPIVGRRRKIFNPIVKTSEPYPFLRRKGFFFAGRLEAMKCVDRLIRIYAMLPITVRAEHEFFIAGSGTMKDEWKTLVQDLKMEDKIHFVGNIPNEKMQEFDAQHKILLMASTREGMPTAIAEALTVGVPVVSTDVGDIKSVIKNGENGFLLSPDFSDEDYVDAISAILNDYETFSRNALATSKLFNAEQVSKGIIEDINQIVNSRG